MALLSFHRIQVVQEEVKGIIEVSCTPIYRINTQEGDMDYTKVTTEEHERKC